MNVRLNAVMALVVLVAASPALSQDEKAVANVPMRAITEGPKAHWFGYYDKHQFDPSGRFVLGMEIGFEDRGPDADDVVQLGMVDTEDGDRWIEIGQSRAWNWQQGCMLQWIPGTEGQVIYNDRRGGKYVAIIRDVFAEHEMIIPHPVYAVSPDGKTGVSVNFARLNETRPGYGYTGVSDPYEDQGAPEDDGVYRVNLETGKAKLIHTYADVANVAPHETMEGGKHWFNHLLFNPDGSRFIFLHRWRSNMEGKGGWRTRMFTTDPAGNELFRVADHGMVSHFIWKNPEQILAWSREPETGSKFHLYTDQTESVEVIGGDVLKRDGHCTYSPDGEWILTDTYPDKNRMQSLMLYRPSDGKLVDLGKFYLPPVSESQLRCDLHPRWNRDGTRICIDSKHSGMRQMYLLDVSGVVD